MPMSTQFARWLHTILDFVFPAQCEYCGAFAGDDRVVIFCRSCWDSIRSCPPQRCRHCGLPLPSEPPAAAGPFAMCRECRITPPDFNHAFSAAYYAGALKAAIHHFKFGQKTSFAGPLADAIITTLPADINISRYDYLVPVPLHPRRRRQRGYNQAALLARHLSRHYHLPVVRQNLIRIRATQPQTRLQGRRARQENIKNAFQLRRPEAFRNKHLIVVDDVLTTGSTLNECARILKQGGAHTVLALTIARAGVSSIIPIQEINSEYRS